MMGQRVVFISECMVLTKTIGTTVLSLRVSMLRERKVVRNYATRIS